MADRVKQTFVFCLMLGSILCVPIFPVWEDEQLYVGSRCTLAGSGENGTCVKIDDCPEKNQAVKEKRYDPADRCGFDNFTEIVCCFLPNITKKLSVSPAEAACQEYENEVSGPGHKVDYHILNGVDAESNEFPYMVALGYATRPSDDPVAGNIKYTCGGTLISRQHVLTAAHCVNNREEEVPIEVRLGSTDLTTVEVNTQRVPVLSTTSYPGFKRSRNYNDIAIIKLQRPVQLTNSVRPACLVTRALKKLDETINQRLVVAGWGVTEFGGLGSTKLQKAVGFRIIELDECAKSFQNQPRLPDGLNDEMICAYHSNTTDACNGDSGGPLLLISSSMQPLVAGVTAFGRACGGTAPSIYASVYKYLSWIETQVWPDT